MAATTGGSGATVSADGGAGTGPVDHLTTSLAAVSLTKGDLVVATDIKVALPAGFPALKPAETWKDVDIHAKKKAQLVAFLEGTLGWTAPSAVQKAALPYLVDEDRYNMRIQSETGTGKTGAFAITMLQHIDPDVKSPQAIVLVPTKELVFMHADRLAPMAKALGIDVIGVVGGGGKDAETRVDTFITAQIVIGTVGKVVHLMGKQVPKPIPGKGKPNILSLTHVNMLVIDEADKLLAESSSDISKLHASCTTGVSRHKDYPFNKLQVLLFSATYEFDEGGSHGHHGHHGSHSAPGSTVDPSAFMVQLLGPPPTGGDASTMDFLKATSAPSATDRRKRVDLIVPPGEKKVTHFTAIVPPKAGDSTAVKIEAIAPILASITAKAIIFSSKTSEVHQIPTCFKASEGTLVCAAIAGKSESSDVVPTAARQAIFHKMDNGEIRLLAASDVYSRGVDVKDLRIVVNMQPPFGPTPTSTYRHRTGRVGRLVSDGGKPKMTVGVIINVADNEHEARDFDNYAAALGRKSVRITLSPADKVKNVDLINEALEEPLVT